MAEKGTTPKKWADKYESPEEMEKGFHNLVRELDKIRAEKTTFEAKAGAAEREAAATRQLIEQMSFQAQAQPEVALFNEEGSLDEQALLSRIDKRLEDAIVKKVPDIVSGQLQNVFQPLQLAQKAKEDYMSSPEGTDFDDADSQKFLARNPGLNKAFQVLAGNPETAKTAYEWLHRTMKQTAPKAAAAVNQEHKQTVSQTPRASGPDAKIPGEEQIDTERLRKLAKVAQDTGDPAAGIAYMKAMMEGSRTLEDLKKLAEDRGLG